MRGQKRVGRPVVMRSIEDAGGDRCVDILRSDGGYSWVECRRDPEDSFGWRRLGEPSGPFGSSEAALAAARSGVGWMEAR
jgi:hypothetical protein